MDLTIIKITAPFLIGSWGLFLFMTIRKPQRFRNSFFLMFALMITGFFLSAFFGDYMSYVLLGEFLLVMLAIMLVPFMLMINGLVMMKKESRSLGNMLSLLLGFVILIGEVASVINVLISGNEENMFVHYVFTAFLGSSIFYVSVLILAFVLYMISIQFVPRRARFDYVVIHGCGLIGGQRVSKLLSNRIDRAIRIYEKAEKKPILVPSGGKGSDEAVSEAYAMAEYMKAHGIPEEHILMEDQSKTTMENLKNSKELIEAREGGHRTALVTSNYHVYRCILYARSIGWKCTGIGAKVAWYYWPSATLREFAAIFSRKKHFLWALAGYIFFVLMPLWALFK